MINLKIRINVDEQVLTLPVDTQFVPGIPEKDPVVMVPKLPPDACIFCRRERVIRQLLPYIVSDKCTDGGKVLLGVGNPRDQRRAEGMRQTPTASAVRRL